MEILIFIILLIVFLLFSAFFSGAEIALSSLDKITVKHLKRKDKKRGARLEALLKDPSRWLITILIGNNLTNVAAASLATLLVSKLLSGAVGLTVGIVTGGMTFVILVFGEITPKRYCQEESGKISLRVAGTIYFLSIILNPFIKGLSLLTGGILKTAKVSPSKSSVTEKDIHTLIDIGQEEGALEAREEKLVHSALEFDEIKVKEVMTPRTQMVCIEEGASLGELKDLIKTSDYSRISVYKKNRDNIVGVVHIKDLLEADSAKQTVKEIMHPPIFVPYTTTLSSVFRRLQKERIHLAVVVGEYGGVVGIVTMEDLLEEIVGEIEDEYGHDEEEIRVQRGGTAIVKAEADIDEVNERLKISLSKKSDYESVGGFIVDLLGRIPKRGESIEYGGVEIKILESDEKKVKVVQIIKKQGVSSEKEKQV